MKQRGLIMRSTGSWYDIRDEQGNRWKGRLRGKHKLQAIKATNPIAVGDYVEFEVEDELEKNVLITDILPRENYISRKSPHKTTLAHIIAANIDQALLMATIALPRTSTGFIDRFLVSAESFRIPAIILFNKYDLLDAQGLAFQQELINTYQQIGYTCLSISALKGDNLEAVRNLLTGKKTLIAGHSGAGKSTLLNSLNPALHLRTSPISAFVGKGVHTTTFAEMFELSPDTFVIDTPGIKELGLADMENEPIAHYFPEMRACLGMCRYHDCQHIQEPDCEVVRRVQSGQIALSRYESYLSMLVDEDNRR
ncbi:MAG: ribosome small subunit-dependent GTPase A [Cytophagales bacterium]|nr:ribosome small subunit-dependent GTPase A [Bernardetiaceae bacterium]MDW8205168.1 ribosome small subunit-dependent GTPase A [Cytophagales bacterium]